MSFRLFDRFLGGFSVSAKTVESTGKDMDDRKEVLGEFLLRRGALVAENREFDAQSFEKPLVEFESEESITKGHAHVL